MTEIDVAVCDGCGEDLPQIFVLRDDNDWYSKVYHATCYQECHCIVRWKKDRNCPVHKDMEDYYR